MRIYHLLVGIPSGAAQWLRGKSESSLQVETGRQFLPTILPKLNYQRLRGATPNQSVWACLLAGGGLETPGGHQSCLSVSPWALRAAKGLCP